MLLITIFFPYSKECHDNYADLGKLFYEYLKRHHLKIFTHGSFKKQPEFLSLENSLNKLYICIAIDKDYAEEDQRPTLSYLFVSFSASVCIYKAACPQMEPINKTTDPIVPSF
jgi:hypothetical protein